MFGICFFSLLPNGSSKLVLAVWSASQSTVVVVAVVVCIFTIITIFVFTIPMVIGGRWWVATVSESTSWFEWRLDHRTLVLMRSIIFTISAAVRTTTDEHPVANRWLLPEAGRKVTKVSLCSTTCCEELVTYILQNMSFSFNDERQRWRYVPSRRLRTGVFWGVIEILSSSLLTRK